MTGSRLMTGDDRPADSERFEALCRAHVMAVRQYCARRASPDAAEDPSPRHAPTRIDFANPDRAPLLLIAGGADHTVPAVVDRAAAERYEKSPAITIYKEFPGRSHFTIGEPGWEEVADYALDWAIRHVQSSVAA